MILLQLFFEIVGEIINAFKESERGQVKWELKT